MVSEFSLFLYVESLFKDAIAKKILQILLKNGPIKNWAYCNHINLYYLWS